MPFSFKKEGAMTAQKAFLIVLGSKKYNRLQYLLSQARIGEVDSSKVCREVTRPLAISIKRVIRRVRRWLPKSERREFNVLISKEIQRLRQLLCSYRV